MARFVRSLCHNLVLRRGGACRVLSRFSVPDAAACLFIGKGVAMAARQRTRYARRVARRRSGAKAAALLCAIALLAGGWVVADIYDVVPGRLTMAPLPPQPNPFPDIPGAVPVAEPISAIMPGLSPDAAIPPASQVQALIATMLADPRMGPHVGVLVQDQLTGEVLGENNQWSAFTPASTQKLLTGVAAFYELDPEARLATVVRQDGSRLILVGGGDMLLSPGEGRPNQIDEHAGIWDLAAATAAQLSLQGRTEVYVEFDDTLFADPRIAPAVPPGEQRIFVAPVASMAVNQARVDLEIKSDSAPRVADPALRTAEIFVEALQAHGITVDGRPARVAGTTEHVTELARVESAPTGEIIEWAMQRSDNTITEVLGRLVALHLGLPTTNNGAIEAVKTVIERLGVNMAGAGLVDLSGLGRGSQLNPNQLVEVVDVAVSGPPMLRDLANGMPIAGLSGTLATRFVGQEFGTGLVRAKTGSLPGVTALAGTVVTANGRLLLFTVVADETPGPGQWGARQAMDQFVTGLAALGQ